MSEIEVSVPPVEGQKAHIPPMLEASVVARVFGISEPGVYALNRKKKLGIEGIQFGRAVRFRTVDLESVVGRSLTPEDISA